MIHISTIEDLDRLLGYLYSKGSNYTPYDIIVEELFEGQEQDPDVQSLLIKIEKDGYVNAYDILYQTPLNGKFQERTFKLSFEGRLLFEECRIFRPRYQPYRNIQITKTINDIYKFVKIIIIMLNAFAILWLMHKAIPAK